MHWHNPSSAIHMTDPTIGATVLHCSEAGAGAGSFEGASPRESPDGRFGPPRQLWLIKLASLAVPARKTSRELKPPNLQDTPSASRRFQLQLTPARPEVLSWRGMEASFYRQTEHGGSQKFVANDTFAQALNECPIFCRDWHIRHGAEDDSLEASLTHKPQENTSCTLKARYWRLRRGSAPVSSCSLKFSPSRLGFQASCQAESSARRQRSSK